MATKSIKGISVPRNDIAKNWAKAINFIPEKSELIVFNADTESYSGTGTATNLDGNEVEFTYESSDKVRFKFGDGINNVNVLPFATTEVDLTDYATQDWVENYIAENVGTGGSGGTIIVDQTYNSESENAQSGKAVAEAIETTVGRKTAESGEIFNQYEDYKDTETNITYKKNVATGLSSSARGSGTQATGDQADASGLNTKATGARSSTRGYGNIASGSDSTADGHHTEASGWASKSSGNLTIASGTFSSAGGRHTIAAGEYSVSDGWDTRALGNHSKAQGIRTIAQGKYGAFAHGGYGGAYSWQTESAGYGCYAVGENSSAKGHSTKAIGYTTNTHGRETIAGMSGFGIANIFRKDANHIEVVLVDGAPSSGGALYDCIKPGVDNNGEFNTDSAFPLSKSSVGEYLSYIEELTSDNVNMPTLFVDGESYIPDNIVISTRDSDNLFDSSKIPGGELSLPGGGSADIVETDATIKELCPDLEIGETVTFTCDCGGSVGFSIGFGTASISGDGVAGFAAGNVVVTEELLNAKLSISGVYGGSISNIKVTRAINEGIVMTFNNGIPNIEYDSDEITVDINTSFTSDANGSYETVYGKNNLSGAELTTNIVEENNATFSHTPNVSILTDGTSISTNHIQVTDKIGTEADYTQTSEYIDLIFKLAKPINNPNKFMIAYRDATGMSSMHYAIYASENTEELFNDCIYEYSSESKNGQENIIDISSKVLTNIKYFAIRLYNLPLWGTCTVISEIALYGGKSSYEFNDKWLGTDYTHGYAGYSVRATVGANANGYKTEAYGQGSNTNGVGTKAISKGQTALGTYNEVNADAIAVFGNGTDEENRSNAFVVNRDGTASVQKSGTHDNNVVTYEQLSRLDATTRTALHQITSQLADVSDTVDSVVSDLESLEDTVDTTNVKLTNLIGCGTDEPTSDMPYLFYIKYEL